jgi:hypothetical protein
MRGLKRITPPDPVRIKPRFRRKKGWNEKLRNIDWEHERE